MGLKANNKLAALIGHEGFTFPNMKETREAIALLVIAMAAEDGDIAEGEEIVISAVMMDNPVYNEDEEEITRCLRQALEDVRADQKTFGEKMEAALDLFQTKASKEVLATMLLAVVAADGQQNEYEVRFGTILMNKLEIDEPRVQELFQKGVGPFFEYIQSSD